MALLSELALAIAAVEGIESAFVAGVARYLREAGLISQAGRGRGAARMSCTDAAALLIGTNATILAKDAPQVVRELSNFHWVDRVHEIGLPASGPRESSGGLIDWALQKGVHGDGSPGRLGVFLERLIASAIPESGDQSRLAQHLSYEDILSITFHRPNASVELYHGFLSASENEASGATYEIGEFIPPKAREAAAGDRRETILITEKTILEVGRVLAS